VREGKYQEQEQHQQLTEQRTADSEQK
jgi:hypothetical protein